jgi:hypothetical protein
MRSFRSRIDLAIRSLPFRTQATPWRTVIPNHDRVHPVRLKVSSRQADDFFFAPFAVRDHRGA